MNKLVWLDLTPWKDAVGWTIVHSFWQLTLIALILYLVLRFIPQKRAELRYACLLTGLLAGLLWSGITFAQEWQSSETTPLPVVFAPLTIDQESVITPPAAPPTRSLLDQAWLLAQKLDAHTPAITVAWLIGMLIFSLYLLFGLGYLKYLEYHRTSLPSDHWQLRLDELSRQMGVKTSVQLYSSGAVNEPITFKLFQPVILVPVYFFTGLTPAQIEVLLLHELAHIRRHDFTVNLLQSLVEILFFFHPAIWWLSARIREEREYCCDNAVLAVQENPFPYVEALTRIQSTQFSYKNKLAMSANGKKSMLSKRVFRLFGRYEQEPSRLKSTFFAFLLLAVSFSAQAFLVQEDTPVQLASLPILEQVSTEETVEIQEQELQPIAGDENRQMGTTAAVISPVPTPQRAVQDTLPLYVIDGVKKASSFDLKDLKPDQIEAISVLKGPKAIEKYGQSGQFGVIEISTKQNAPDQAEDAKSGSERPANEGTIRIRARTKNSETIVTGTVTDENNKPIIGANVLIKGTRSGTITDFTGEFELRLPEDCVTLVFSYIGKASTELKDVCAGEEKVIVQLDGSETPAVQENVSTRPIVSGRILTQDQTPLVGANIIIKGTTRGTISDMQGNFRLELSQGCPTLIVSYIGMKPKMLKNLCEGKDLQIVLEQKPANAASPIVTPDTNPASILGELDELPKSLAFKVFPNPASELVNISFQLQEETKVKLSVYSLDGKLLQTLVDQTLGAGSQQFSWEAKELKGTFPILLEVPAGIVRQQVVIE